MEMHPSEDAFSDESENAVLLRPAPIIGDIENENHQSFEVKYRINSSQRGSYNMPSGKKFILKADEIHPTYYRCRSCLGILLCITTILLATSWMMTEDENIGTMIAYIMFIVAFIFILYLLIIIMFRIISRNKEQWTIYVLIINVYKNTFYVIDESNHKNWEISCIGVIDELNMTIKRKTDKYNKDKSYVMIDQTRFNLHCVRYEEAKKFIKLIEDYLQQIWKHQYLNEQHMNGDILAKVDNNDDEKYNINELDYGLKGLINELMDELDINKAVDGQKLDEWYKRDSDELLKEYKQLIKQRDDERKRFKKYMNFEPKFNTDYIAKMLLVKCSVLEILSE